MVKDCSGRRCCVVVIGLLLLLLEEADDIRHLGTVQFHIIA